MAATATYEDRGTAGGAPSPMTAPLLASFLVHCALVVAALIGLPFFNSPPPPINTAIAVEILPIAELTTSNKPPVTIPPPPVEKPPEVKPVETVKPPAPPKVDTVEPPKQVTPPKPKVESKPKPKPVVPPPPTEKLEKPKEEPKPKPEEKPAEPETQAQDFQSLLKNLQESQPQQVPQDLPEAKEAPPPMPSAQAPFADTLTMNELDALRHQLSQCWSIQAGARYAENLVVEVRILVAADRRVTSATIVDQWRYGQDSYFRAAADSAIRAINSPQCAVLNLNPEKYHLWKDIVVTFDPREML
ncbi:MAG: energy transducer TonB [Micavibrio sp.]